MASLIIDKRLVDAGSVCLAVAGEVDMDTFDQLEAAIRSSLREGNLTRLVVDFEKVTFLDTQGIAILMGSYSVAASAGRLRSPACSTCSPSRSGGRRSRPRGGTDWGGPNRAG